MKMIYVCRFVRVEWGELEAETVVAVAGVEKEQQAHGEVLQADGVGAAKSRQ